MLFSSVTTVNVQRLTHTEWQAKQILIINTFDSQSLRQKRHERAAVANKSTMTYLGC